MTTAALLNSKIPTKSPQLRPAKAKGPASGKTSRSSAGRGTERISGAARPSTRGDAEVVEVAGGITVYPARFPGDRWRAVWSEGGRRRECESVSEPKLAAKLAKVRERLAADAVHAEEPGSALIAHYFSPGRHPAGRPWSRKHADTQARLCSRYLAPVISDLPCEDIRQADMQAAVNAAPTSGEGDRVARCVSALVTAGLDAGYLTNPRLAKVRWQPGDRPPPEPVTTIAGESPLYVDPGDIPADTDVTALARALAYLDPDYELMAYTAAYTGLRWGELAALAIDQTDTDGRTITVDRKIIEIGGTLHLEAPKGRKKRRTIYPNQTPGGYPLAQRLAERIQAAQTEQQAGTNPSGLIFPSPRGTWWRSSNYARRVLAPAYTAIGWRGPSPKPWTWHSLRHVFCTTALFTWNLDPADVSRLAGHANIRITLDMYIGTTAGTLTRARTATS
jgi:integrase